MSHKADRSFFDKKKSWSERKDLVLGYYLKPYLAKVSTLRRPILIVDGFAGRGKFKDGRDGSPLIIGRTVERRLTNGCRVPISVLCVESDDVLYEDLVGNLKAFPFASARHQTFLQTVDEIEQAAQDHTVFLYLDPYAIVGLEWPALERVFRFLRQNSSVEILLNFNASAFCRYGRSVLGFKTPAEDDDPVDAHLPETLSLERLDLIVGGSWWLQFFDGETEFVEQVDMVIRGFCNRLSEYFEEVCRHDIKTKCQQSSLKYTLLFGSRHPDALILMNDAAVRSREMWAEETGRSPQGTLFETRPREVVPDPCSFRDAIIALATTWLTYEELRLRVIRERFGQYREPEINKHIRSLLKEGRLESEGGSSTITDKDRVRARQ